MSERFTKASITLESTHPCGQVFTQTVVLAMDDTFQLTLCADPNALSQLASAAPIAKLLDIPTDVTVTGRKVSLDISGIGLQDHKLICLKCKQDLQSVPGSRAVPPSRVSASDDTAEPGNTPE